MAHCAVIVLQKETAMSQLDAIFVDATPAIDPVCGMDVDRTSPPGGTSEHAGETYYFCAPGCRKAFEMSPGTYLGAGT